MGQLQRVLPDLAELGYRVLAVSADRPEKVREQVKSDEQRYTPLSDRKLVAARAFGLAYRVDDETFDRYKAFGLDLEAASGETHHLLPVPAVFLTGKGKIRFEYVNPDYKVRLDPDVLLAAAKASLR